MKHSNKQIAVCSTQFKYLHNFGKTDASLKMLMCRFEVKPPFSYTPYIDFKMIAI